MFLSILLLMLLVGIAVYQAMHGLFNALIMMVLTVCCAALALGSFEWVAIHWVAPHWKQEYAHAVALAGLFGIPLIVLRVAIDQIIKRSSLLPAWLDRAGGGLCGIVTAFFVVGVLALSLQLIPFNNSILGYARFEIPNSEYDDEDEEPPSPPDPDAKEAELLLSPDRFAIKWLGLFSSGVFSGEREFAGQHADYVQAMGWASTTRAEVSRYVPPRSVQIVRTQVVDYVYDIKARGRRGGGSAEYVSHESEAGLEFRMIRVKLANEARDSYKKHMFTLRQFRIVGYDDPEDHRRLAQYHAIATQENLTADLTAERIGSEPNRHLITQVRWGKKWPYTESLLEPRDDHPEEVEVVFELPKTFEPWYLEYKRGARVSVSFDDEDTTTASLTPPPARATTPPTTLVSSSPSAGDTVPSKRRGGRARGATTYRGSSKFGDAMPQTLTSYRTQDSNTEIRRGVLHEGHVIGARREGSSRSGQTIKRFDVPGDKRLLQLDIKNLRARSTLGRAKEFAVKNLQNYFVRDEEGKRYKICGKYAIADVDGDEVFEIQYYPNQIGTLGGLKKFERIQERHLRRDYQLVFLFLVDPGARIVAFSTGGRATREDDLDTENLVAPQ